MAATRYPRIWLVVADGEHARVVVPSQAEGQFRTERTYDSATAHMKSADLGTDRPGRVHESASPTRHGVSPRHDLHAEAKRGFAAFVAEQVSAAEHDFDRLVLVAPGHALHDLRDALDARTAAKVTGALEKDLVKIPDHELSAHLAEWWTPWQAVAG